MTQRLVGERDEGPARRRLARRWPRAGLVVLTLTAVCASILWSRSPRVEAWSPTTHSATAEWLVHHEGDYHLAVKNARAWLEPLRADPAEMRRHGIKGKKKLAELIDAWGRLRAVELDEAEKASILAHIDSLAEVTRTAEYHDMLTVDDTVFKQDATSYLRAAYLLERQGLDTTLYRHEIARAHDRLNDHMPTRGPFQRLVFHRYYAWFGLAEPFPLAVAREDGLIARRAPPAEMDRMDVYHLTHEVFAPYDYGDDLDVEPFDEDELRYLRPALLLLVDQYIERNDPDLVAELVSCLRYIRAVDLPAYTDGLGFLLASQKADGHWGDYTAHARKHGAWDATWRLELHTTMVAIDALTVAFHRDWNRDVTPRLPAEQP